jgi:hypothetical protein
MRDAPGRHDDDAVGLVDHRLFEAVLEWIAGEAEHRPPDGDRSRRLGMRGPFGHGPP